MLDRGDEIAIEDRSAVDRNMTEGCVHRWNREAKPFIFR
jgi:hypothetical protein